MSNVPMKKPHTPNVHKHMADIESRKKAIEEMPESKQSWRSDKDAERTAHIKSIAHTLHPSPEMVERVRREAEGQTNNYTFKTPTVPNTANLSKEGNPLPVERLEEAVSSILSGGNLDNFTSEEKAQLLKIATHIVKVTKEGTEETNVEPTNSK